jgi:hypothetical protein
MYGAHVHVRWVTVFMSENKRKEYLKSAIRHPCPSTGGGERKKKRKEKKRTRGNNEARTREAARIQLSRDALYRGPIQSCDPRLSLGRLMPRGPDKIRLSYLILSYLIFRFGSRLSLLAATFSMKLVLLTFVLALGATSMVNSALDSSSPPIIAAARPPFLLVSSGGPLVPR